jgi:hypothetical protein
MGNTSIQFFAKSVIPLFTAGILLVFLDLGLKKRSAGYLLGLALCAYILKTNLGEYIGEGYSDIPAAFLGLMAFYSLLRIDPQKENFQKAYIQGAIFAGASAVTKQTGVFIFFLYAIFAFFIYFYPSKDLSFREKVQKWLLPLIIVGLVVAPWYIYKQIAIIQGWEKSEVGVIGEITNQVHDQANIFLRSYQAFISLGKVLIFFGLAILSIILVDKRFKYLVLGVIVPFTLIWSVYASYDSRNLAMMYPLVAMVCGVGIDRSLDIMAPRLSKLKLNKIPVASLLILVILGGGLYLSRVSNSDLISHQETLQRQIFNPRLNEKIYGLITETGKDTLFVTDYPIRYLPGLENNQLKIRFNDLQKLIEALKDPGVKFILLPRSASQEIDDYIAEAVNRGQLEFLFTDTRWKPYTMYRIISPIK